MCGAVISEYQFSPNPNKIKKRNGGVRKSKIGVWEAGNRPAQSIFPYQNTWLPISMEAFSWTSSSRRHLWPGTASDPRRRSEASPKVALNWGPPSQRFPLRPSSPCCCSGNWKHRCTSDQRLRSRQTPNTNSGAITIPAGASPYTITTWHWSEDISDWKHHQHLFFLSLPLNTFPSSQTFSHFYFLFKCSLIMILT